MAHFIFSNELFLRLLNEQEQRRVEESKQLYSRLGVKPAKNESVTLIIVAANNWAGYDALMTLQEECEEIYGKKIDAEKIRYVVLRTLDDARKSPYLEIANFIIVLNEDLIGARNYPELGEILPFM